MTACHGMPQPVAQGRLRSLWRTCIDLCSHCAPVLSPPSCDYGSICIVNISTVTIAVVMAAQDEGMSAAEMIAANESGMSEEELSNLTYLPPTNCSLACCNIHIVSSVPSARRASPAAWPLACQHSLPRLTVGYRTCFDPHARDQCLERHWHSIPL
eukprot:COSAG02_NODE_2347_length_9092_cov_4.284666_2_plen_156_part_00